MRVLVVYCHPDPASFAATLHAAVVETLIDHGHGVIDLDLYREGFRPVLNQAEHADYAESPCYPESIAKYAKQLAEAEAIVAVYPTWWYGWPAMLKGYFDRVWAPGVAYDMSPEGKVDTTRLAHIRRIGVVTTYGAPWWLIRLYMGDPERKLWSRGVRPLCAKSCRLNWFARYDMDRATPHGLRRFVTQVRRGIARW